MARKKKEKRLCRVTYAGLRGMGHTQNTGWARRLLDVIRNRNQSRQPERARTIRRGEACALCGSLEEMWGLWISDAARMLGREALDD